jgi:hypothetical protein
VEHVVFELGVDVGDWEELIGGLVGVDDGQVDELTDCHVG